VSSNLIDVDLRGYEPEEEPEDAQPKVLEIRPIGRVTTRLGSQRKPPHPPGPAGLDLPPTRVWIKRPPGPAGLDAPRTRPSLKRPPGPAGL
jgi:hypothetical protein